MLYKRAFRILQSPSAKSKSFTIIMRNTVVGNLVLVDET